MSLSLFPSLNFLHSLHDLLHGDDDDDDSYEASNAFSLNVLSIVCLSREEQSKRRKIKTTE